MEIKTRVKKLEPIKLKSFYIHTHTHTHKLLHSKGNYKQGEKTTLRMGENNSK